MGGRADEGVGRGRGRRPYKLMQMLGNGKSLWRLPYQFRLVDVGELGALEPKALHSGLVLEGDGEFLFDALAVDGAGVVGAERVDLAIGRGVVDHAAFDTLYVAIAAIP